MGQKDLINSPNLLQAERSLPQENILVGKEMCQNRNRSSKCQNGKRLRERKWCVDFKQQSKKIKISRDLEKLAVQNVVANMDKTSECGFQMDDKLATEDFPTAWGNLNYNERTCLSFLEHRPDFLLEQLHQRPQNLLDSLSCNEKVSEEHLATCDASDFEKSLDLRKEDVLEIKSMEAEISVDKKSNCDNSIVKMLVSEKLNSSNSNVGDCMKTKKAPKDKIVSKAGENLQLYSCQRAVPISGKNAWPHESCARTNVWVHKNHVRDLERKILTGTDLLVNSVEEESHKPWISTSKPLADKIIDPKAELPTESCASEFSIHVDNIFSVVSSGSKCYSMNRPNQYRSVSKMGKKLKVGSDLLGKVVKNNRSIAKRSISINVQNVAFANSKSKTNEQKTSVTKQELFLQTLIPRSLLDFKIPLLRNKNEYEKAKYPTSDRNTCCHLDILEESTSRNKSRAEQTSSDLNSKYQFQSEQVNATISKEHANQFDIDFPESHYKKNNECVETSNESELKTSNFDNSFDSLRTEFKEKHILDSVLVPDSKDEGNNSNNSAQVRDNFQADVLQAYEDDVLVIDVIQDDPDLFGDTGEQEAACTEKHFTKANFNTSIFSEKKLKLEPESPPLPGCRYLKLCPRENPVEDYARLKSDADFPSTEADEIKSRSPSEISSIGGVTVSSVEEGQLTVLDYKSCITNEKYKPQEKMLAAKEGKANIRNIAKIDNTQYIEPVTHDHELGLSLPAMKATAPQWHSTGMEPWRNDFRFSRKGPLWPTSYPNRHNSWKVGKDGLINLGLLHIPHGYCRSHFNTLNGCERTDCWFWHVPTSGNEQFCSEILRKYISTGEVVLLQRAVQIFTDYCRNNIPRLYLNSKILNDLLASLLQFCLLKELFLVVHTGIMIKILPTVDILLKVFEQVASMKLKDTVPDLINISCKLIDAGMVLEYEHFGCIIRFLNQLQVSSQEITTFMTRFQGRHFKKACLCDFDSAVAEFQHCKEKDDWAKLGTLYINVRRGCGNVDDLQKYSLCIANILTSAMKEETPVIPFCVFAAAVNADGRHTEADKNLLGRIGISVMFSYYRKQQWSKARKVLDVLHALQIPFTFFKGLLGHERLAPRCHIVNVAVEIFLKCGSLDGAIWVLKESDWVINTLSWPCDRMDVLNRHNLLCTMATEYITKSRYGEAFEVLQNLPGFQNSSDTLDVSQYSLLFNKLLGACLESKNLGMSSAVVDFMLTKNIPVEFHLLRSLITTLGRSCLWLKARTHYKSALALGCYPPLEGNLYRKLLLIPSYMTEVEMLLAIEIFMVANASSIQSPGASIQILQIVLKRCEDSNVRNDDDYRSAVERLIQAARISTPRLFIKHLTVNINKEQVYSLEYASVLKWLKENMKWAGKVWLF
ncbi:protein TOPAZ1 isoform X2 [Sceloporus undulatus]|nr:protein TOPAZ1 isoform X2 [Sceloporus undulatus]XP_042332768.1 protein TOPAZ1 isoform X2 [Sceloporus undulatus]